MNESINTICPRPEIIPYLDGELSVREEELLEFHLINCECCNNQLREQKQLLCAMGSAFDNHPEIELPKNFAKVVAVRAESDVQGLRSRKERKLAFFFGSLLIIFALFGLSGKFDILLNLAQKIVEQLKVFMTFIFHFIFDLTVGIAAVLRILSYELIFKSENSIILVFCCFMFALGTLFFAFRKRNLI